MFDCDVGDWIGGPGGGIWRVFRRERHCDRRVPGHLAEPLAGGLVFASRFLTPTARYRVEDRSWHVSLCRPLLPPQEWLLRYIKWSRPALVAAFDSRRPVSPDLLFNVQMALPDSASRELPAEFVAAVRAGLSQTEILDELQRSSLAPYVCQYPYTTHLQFRCLGHELRGNQFIFRTARWLGQPGTTP